MFALTCPENTHAERQYPQSTAGASSECACGTLDGEFSDLLSGHYLEINPNITAVFGTSIRVELTCPNLNEFNLKT